MINLSGKKIAFFLVTIILSISFLLNEDGMHNYEQKQKTTTLSFNELLNSIEQEEVQEVLLDNKEAFIIKKAEPQKLYFVETNNAMHYALTNLLMEKRIKFKIKKENSVATFLYYNFTSLLLILLVFLSFIFSKNLMPFKRRRFLTKKEKKTSFENVAGLYEAKNELKEIIDFLKNPSSYIDSGARIPKGVLLSGDPGTGKTLLAKAVAGEANCAFLYASGSQFEEVFAGLGASRIRELFDEAKENLPCIIFIDEIDSLGKKRSSMMKDSDQTLNELLTQLDGFEEKKGIIVFAATNCPAELDPALLRSGRFDRKINLSLPTKEERLEILKLYTKNLILSEDLNLEEVAHQTFGFSGADIENFINECSLMKKKLKKNNIDKEITSECIEKIFTSKLHTSNYRTNTKITFENVAGVDEAKAELYEIVDFLKNPKKYENIGGRIPKGVLLTGEPGTGKTLLAKAVAGEANCSFFYASASQFEEIYVGTGSKKIRELFDEARKNKPSAIFIDEIDTIGGNRFNKNSYYNNNQTLNELLTQMDGFKDNSGVIIFAATNKADILDPALLRSGRFDRIVHIDLPSIAQREEILKIHAKKIKMSEDLDLKSIAQATPGFSGADLENLVNESALLAAKLNLNFANYDCFLQSIDKIKMGPEKKSFIMTEKDRTNTAYHEAGHAIIAYFLKDTDKIHKVTIVPRGMSAGMVSLLPNEESKSKTYYFNLIKICMGGAAAEEIKFGEDNRTAGAVSDIKSATNIANNIVKKFGMSEMGMVNYENDISDETLQKTEATVKNIIDEAFLFAKNFLKEKHLEFETLAQELLKKETLSLEEIEKLISNN